MPNQRGHERVFAGPEWEKTECEKYLPSRGN
jgi:hypothetical protein